MDLAISEIKKTKMPLPDPDKLELKIKRLNEMLWERRVSGASLTKWLSRFSAPNPSGVDERHHMLYLLSNFLYFGNREIRELLRAQHELYVLRPIIAKIRRQLRDEGGNAADVDEIDRRKNIAIGRTRFLGLGNPAESGPHLLYYYRQENRLRSHQFINPIQLPGWAAEPEHCPANVDKYVLIDDFCGSSTQAGEFARDILRKARAACPQLDIAYYPLFATRTGIRMVRQMPEFSDAQCVIELDDSFKCFSDTSRFYKDNNLKDEGYAIAKTYGDILLSDHPLGYKDGQLAIGFNHNTPDNALPIFWVDWGPGWYPPFPRYNKQL
jgi:hypothetical protein